MSTNQEALDSILNKVKTSETLQPDECQTLVDSFASPDQSTAYLALSLLWQTARNEGAGAGSMSVEELTHEFEKATLERLSETNESSLIRGVSFITALFRVDAESAIAMLSNEGLLEDIMDGVDISPSPELSLAAARLLGEASGHKKSRAVIPRNVRQWLDVQLKQKRNEELAASSGVALAKLWHSASSDKRDETQEDSGPDINVAALTSRLVDVVLSKSNSLAVAEAVEGLAYLSTSPPIKETLSNDSTFLKRLFEVIPVRKTSGDGAGAGSRINSALLYGIISIIHNLARRRPVLSEEQKQIAKLRKMANSSLEPKEEAVLDDNEHVKARIHRLVMANVLPVLSVVAILSDSHAVQLDIGRIFLNIVEEKDLRGKVLQTGGGRALRSIVKQLTPTPQETDFKWSTTPVAFEPIQALAKLSITSPPIHVYGPDVGATLDAIRPMSLLVIHQSSTQLQQFEGMMALTNLASSGPEAAGRIANVEGLLNKVELLLLEDHTLLCRASMELICNLVSGSDPAFERYAGGTKEKSPKSKVQVVLALCDTDDVPTRMAASGTLAVLSSSVQVCRTLFDLQLETGRFLPIMIGLLSPIVHQDSSEAKEDKNLIHRAAVCIQSFLSQIESSQLEELKSKEDFLKLQSVLVGLVKRAKSLDLGDAIPPLAEAARMVLTMKK